MTEENIEKPNPRFTGIFIHYEMLKIKELSPLELILLSWIDALYNEKYRGCFASNRHLAETLNVKQNTIAKLIVKLRKMGFIEDVSFNGTIRVIRSCVAQKVIQMQSNPTIGKKSNSTIGKKSIPPLEKNPTNSKAYSKVRKKEKDKKEKFITKEKVASSSEEIASSSSVCVSLIFGKLYQKVKLTQKQLDDLHKEFGVEKISFWIEELDGYLASTGKKYLNHSATIRNWIKKDALKNIASGAISNEKTQERIEICRKLMKHSTEYQYDKSKQMLVYSNGRSQTEYKLSGKDDDWESLIQMVKRNNL